MSFENKIYGSYKKWLLHHLSKHKLLVVGVLFGIIIVTLTRTLVPLIIGVIIDYVFPSLDNAKLVIMLIIGLVIFLIRNVMDYITMVFLGHKLGLKIELNMRKEFFDTMQLKPLKYHDNAQAGDLQALATNDVRIVNTMLSHGAFYLYPFFQVFITILLLFLVVDLRLAMISLPSILLYLYFILSYRKKIAPYAATRLRKHSDLAIVLQDSITGASVVRSFAAEELEREKFSKAVIAFRDNSIGENIVQSRFYPLLMLYISIGITFFVSVIFIFQGSLKAGVLISTNLLLITLIDPTNLIWWATNDMMSGFAACSRLYTALFEEYNEERNNLNTKWPEDFKGKIEFKNVTFAYGGGEKENPPVLKNLSFTIEPNQRIALVGPTGCGKTTLAKLLLLLYKPQEGTILLDGINIQDYRVEELRRHIGYVEQDIYLFSRTIYENISFGKPNATQEEIINVAKLAQVNEFVQNFTDKYYTIVGERGTRLSGGEKQRVAIARAFLTDPKILILDDSVSAVDSETEEKIAQATENILKDRTTIVMTHRLHTIRTSDNIIMLKHGQIAAIGKHAALLQSSEDYRRIFGKHMTLPELKVKN
ncbi:hypothetical protein LCGC14_0584480 [marine sediment metagenome]|uniref:ABC transporter ATP-binding protein n=1 Tax=marine sediment metagenome TaxID=412755 RepID=A0A0F9UNL5_9ZZZZ|nr:MAG: putative ABC transporter ATP-binding protein [Candidatus Lokiarchaeum sp. GC14_75]HEC39793.1 ABC transporter ATP-binding protein [bacterium]